MFKQFKLISGLLIIAVAATFPLLAFAQQEGVGNTQPEPALYGEEMGTGEQVMGESQSVGSSVGSDEEAGEEQPAFTREMRGQQSPRGEGLTRRNRVANAVQEMLHVAERNEGVGTKIREIAREQNRVHEEMEECLEAAQERKGWVKFFIGPNYGKLKEVEERLEGHVERLGELKELRAKVANQGDAQLLQEQLGVMEQVVSELKGEVETAKKGFSLFGWLNRLLSR